MAVTSPEHTAEGGGGDVPSRPRWRRVALVLVLVAVAGMVAMWAYVVFLAFGPGRKPPFDRLADPTFARAAEQRCADARDDISRLPLATTLRDGDARARSVEAGDAVLVAMLDDLARVAPPGEPGTYVDAWIADWRHYLGDRQRYADRLRKDTNAPFLVSVKPGTTDQITQVIDDFAIANLMLSCKTDV
jgi:hypothetical protein